MSIAEQHALERAVTGLAIGVHREVARRRERDRDGEPAERTEQWQIDLTGRATSTPGTAVVELDFQHAFLTAIARRMSQLDRPHFHSGFELTVVNDVAGNPSATPPMMSAAVVKWDLDGGMNITGASVAITAHAPVGDLTFRGVAHLSFQGYGVVRDSQPDEED